MKLFVLDAAYDLSMILPAQTDLYHAPLILTLETRSFARIFFSYRAQRPSYTGFHHAI